MDFATNYMNLKLVREHTYNISPFLQNTISLYLKDINFTKSSVKGNISANGSVQLDEKSTVVGDISSVMMSCNGRIKGNLKIEGKAHFLNETILVGNVCAGSLVIEEGARIKGDVSTSNNSTGDMEDPFKDLQ